jgi:hypothetical protein
MAALRLRLFAFSFGICQKRGLAADLANAIGAAYHAITAGYRSARPARVERARQLIRFMVAPRGELLQRRIETRVRELCGRFEREAAGLPRELDRERARKRNRVSRFVRKGRAPEISK